MLTTLGYDNRYRSALARLLVAFLEFLRSQGTAQIRIENRQYTASVGPLLSHGAAHPAVKSLNVIQWMSTAYSSLQNYASYHLSAGNT